ncbi:(Uracil-5)-methyltransferase [Gemmatirosa kalamazoonensis]|uniref:(Uracil-5)-methyltransferase n=1 Tax=Gemmatirosa kalamazoonensis TaxID=861299 RepID=W0RNC7_9BACT|nr:class I SAM-dependent RNA methyltransferase [Gemmatirosa kalamazoonensis]AHG90953.1 (Uracil-5)-methyltransferase [Gemmatirosa kalamazoonensis]
MSGGRVAREQPDAVEVTIDSIAAGGDGVGRAGGVVVFAPRTAPGDVVRARLSMEGRLARARVERIVTPSTLRVEPPCPHYVEDRCGGCQIQHLSLDAQRGAKRRIVDDALRRLARRDANVDAVQSAGEPWRYRRKLTLALRRRGGRWIAGLHAFDAPGLVFALRDCPITDERVVAVWREVLAASEHLPNDAAELRGAVRLLDEGAAFALEGGARWPGARRFFDAVTRVVALWWTPERGRRLLLLDRRADDVPGASFVQVNPAVSERLRDDLVRAVLSHGPTSAIDGYAGAGDTALRLAAAGVRVTAIEVDDEAVRFARGRLPDGSVALGGTVEARLGDALPADVVIVNPPRGGLHSRVPELLEHAASAPDGPRALFYVSCNPATLARDLARLPSWSLERVTPYDMFPQTAHVETVCELRPARGS